MSEAFVYEFINKVNGKKYIGYHLGSELDGYDTSSKCEEMNEAFTHGELDRTIIARGTHEEMILLERKILVEIDAKNNPQYYNMSNGGGAQLKGYIKPTLDTFHDQILRKEFEISVYEPLENVKDIENLQVRFNEIDGNHQRQLKDRIDDRSGDTSDFEPVIILLDYYGKSENVLLDGNHRLSAALSSKRAKYIPVMYIPRSAYKHLKHHDLETLANRLNPVEEKVRLSADKNDALKWILSRYENQKVPVDSPSNREELIDHWNFTTRQVNGFIKAAKNELVNRSRVRPGYNWIDWTSAFRKKQLKSILEQERNATTISVAMSSAKFNWNNILEKAAANADKKSVTVLIHHPSPKAEEDWMTTHAPTHMDVYKKLIAASGLMIKFKVLDTEEENSLQDSADVV